MMFLRILATISFLALFAAKASIANTINPNDHPAEFIQDLGNELLSVIIEKQDDIETQGIAPIYEIVDTYILPYANLEKTTRLSAGRYWRQASSEQHSELIKAFTHTLIRTYSGAFKQVKSNSKLVVRPFRGDPKADDVVVRSALTQGNAPSIEIDYRMEKTPDGWKIYDLNVEGIWLIQNYRNQFSQEITRNGIDGLIATLNSRNK